MVGGWAPGWHSTLGSIVSIGIWQWEKTDIHGMLCQYKQPAVSYWVVGRLTSAIEVICWFKMLWNGFRNVFVTVVVSAVLTSGLVPTLRDCFECLSFGRGDSVFTQPIFSVIVCHSLWTKGARWDPVSSYWNNGIHFPLSGQEVGRSTPTAFQKQGSRGREQETHRGRERKIEVGKERHTGGERERQRWGKRDNKIERTRNNRDEKDCALRKEWVNKMEEERESEHTGGKHCALHIE